MQNILQNWNVSTLSAKKIKAMKMILKLCNKYVDEKKAIIKIEKQQRKSFIFVKNSFPNVSFILNSVNWQELEIIHQSCEANEVMFSKFWVSTRIVLLRRDTLRCLTICLLRQKHTLYFGRANVVSFAAKMRILQYTSQCGKWPIFWAVLHLFTLKQELIKSVKGMQIYC